jgi:galactokinase
MSQFDIDAARHQFLELFGRDAECVVRAPGRVNLIGEHTDYSDGFVCPMAIEPGIYFVATKREDEQVCVRSGLFPDMPVEFGITDDLAPGEPKWGNYVKGMTHFLKVGGVPLVGMDALVLNILPPGGGLSSSAAMEVGTATALLKLAGQELDADRLALLAQQAEQQFAGVPCGIMDQMIVAAGHAGHAMLLDCRDLSKQFVPIDPAAVSVIVINSMTEHELSGGEYAERRKQCEAGAAHFGVEKLRDVTPQQVDAAVGDLDPTVFKRCRHVTTENARCQAFAEKLAAGDYASAGELMAASHASLSGDFEVSTPELDWLAAEAVKHEGVHGSRMTGGGFGGCTVTLATPEKAEQVLQAVTGAYEQHTGKKPEAFLTAAAAGAEVVE